jgi:hypothetical protein
MILWVPIDEIRKKTFTISFLVTVVGIFLSLFGFIEAAEYFHVLEIKQKNLMFFMGMVVAAFLLGMLHNIILIRKLKLISLQEKIQEVDKSLSRLKVSVTNIKNEGNYYKLIYLSWILKNEYEKSRFKDITGEDSKIYSITAQRPINYIISIIQGIMNRLSSHDVFMTISNLQFWEHITEDKTFLEANITAVKENGVKIDRIVLLDKRVLFLPNSEKEKANLRSTVAALRDFYLLHKEAFTDKLLWQFYVSDNYDFDNEKPVPYAIITNTHNGNSDCMFMHPVTTQSGDGLQMNLRFGRKMSEVNISSYKVKFDTLKTRQLLSIEQVYSRLFDANGEWNI